MRHPIQIALAFPHTADSHPGARMDLDTLTRLDFRPLDPDRFPAVGLARRVIDAPATTAGAILNAANEAAVAAFLDRRIPFGEITRTVERTLDAVPARPLTTLAGALEADAIARAHAEQRIGTIRTSAGA